MPKLDLRKQLGLLYDASPEPALIRVPAMDFLMIDGSGDPRTSAEHQRAVEVLFSFSYALKFAIKKHGGPDYGVLPSEGPWRVDHPAALDLERRENWRWTSDHAARPGQRRAVEKASEEV